jgi:large subunit ribosomal protein L15
MKLNQLRDNPGSTKKPIRVGRGIGSGKGKTSGRGVKGQKARTGVSVNGFEGGQMPLFRRLPKRGFNNPSAMKYGEITLGQLQAAIDAGKLDAKNTLDCAAFKNADLAAKSCDGMRLLGGGTLKSKVTLKIAGATASAQEAVKKAGGTLEMTYNNEAGPRKPEKTHKDKKSVKGDTKKARKAKKKASAKSAPKAAKKTAKKTK